MAKLIEKEEHGRSDNASSEMENILTIETADENDCKGKKTWGSGLLYSVEENPTWYLCILFGLQHYLVAIGSLVGIPLIIASRLCMADDDDGYVARALIISSLFFTSGIITLLQTTLGIRLPIMQGATASFLAPTFAILSLPHNQCPDPLPQGFMNSTVTLYNDTDGSIVDGNELWMRRMREVQGAIAIASCLQIILGFTGAVGFLLRYIGPLTLAPAVALIGLDLFSVAYSMAASHWGIAMFTASILIVCSQFLKNIKVPLPTFSRLKKFHFTWTPVFKLFPVIIALLSAWILSIILTETNVFPTDPRNPSYRARTDTRSSVVSNAPWFKIPYPFQWGLPRVRVAGVIGMLAGVLAGIVESIGDYYACARLSGAPNPPSHAVNRGILVEGFGCVIAGLIGTGTATTSFSQNVGAIGITRVGSRRVLQIAGCFLVLLGMLSKFGSIFVTIPSPVIGGMFCVLFGMIVAVGLSNLQYVDLNSPRNLFIIGFSLFMGLTVPQWIKSNPGVIQTGSIEADQILTVLLQTSMLLGGVLGFIFDNVIPGTEAERGIVAWRNTQKGGGVENDENLKNRVANCYKLPFRTTCCKISRFLPFLPEFEEGDNIEESETTNADHIAI